MTTPSRFGAPAQALTIAVTGLAAFIAALQVGRSGVIRLPGVRATTPGDTNNYHPTFARTSGPQLVMVYFGSARCAWSNNKDLPALVERIKVSLARQARAHGWSLDAVGVALDWSWEEGVGHLRKMGEFDEVSAGYNWANASALRYFGDQVPGPASTPQIVVLRRTLSKPDFVSVFGYQVADEQIVARKVGFFEIARWASNDAALPEMGLPIRQRR